MSSQAASYFVDISTTIPAQERQQWEKDVQQAESQRLADPAAMDMLGARQVSHDNGRQTDVNPETYTDAEKWIQMAINIEETQCTSDYSHKCCL